jgi:hypothetical protein
MSRVTYTNAPATADQEALRAAHQVRLVAEAEEGTGVTALPGGVYGFTYSPALPSAPLFQTRRYRSFETHKLADGEVLIVGFASAEDARQVASATSEVSISVQPEPEAGADVLVAIPYSRIRQHRQYTVHTEHGITLTLT